jgi:hypothetical protein
MYTSHDSGHSLLDMLHSLMHIVGCKIISYSLVYFECLGPLFALPLFSLPLALDPFVLAGAETVLSMGTAAGIGFSCLAVSPIVSLFVELAMSDVLLANGIGLAKSPRLRLVESIVELRLACLPPPADKGG